MFFLTLIATALPHGRDDKLTLANAMSVIG
jgi:hypothetical protein